MQIVNEKIDNCVKCNRKTIHIRNEKKINWLMHIFLMIITGFLWSFIFIIMLIFSEKSKENWICSVCGTSESILS